LQLHGQPAMNLISYLFDLDLSEGGVFIVRPD
jgi:hypothetical protein